MTTLLRHDAALISVTPPLPICDVVYVIDKVFILQPKERNL